MSQSIESDLIRPQQLPRAWWQYCLAGVLFAGAAWFVVMSFIDRASGWELVDTIEPIPIRVDPSITEVDRVPAEPGSLADANVLFVTFDTTRADRIACYGNPKIRTPHLDRLAREGVIFNQAVAVAPTTLPSHSSIMTGLFPYHHGARANANYRLSNEHDTCAEILQDHGYATAAFVSAMVLKGSFGLSQGFDVYSDDVSEGVARPWTGDLVLPGNRTTDRAVEWISRHGDDRFFVWVHYFDPHAPHEAPPPYDEKFEVDYDGEIAFTDEQLGRLLAAVDSKKQLDNTLVVVVGDHGESLGQHGEWTHGILVHGSTLHVPMIMACGSRLGGGVQVPRHVSQVDVLPTVLSLLGIAPSSETDGIDLTQGVPEERFLYSDTLEGYVQYGLAPLIALTKGKHRYIHGPEPELYDLSKDPFESRNIIGEAPQLAEQLKREIQDVVGEDISASLFADPTEELDPATREKLAALGYTRDGNFAACKDCVIEPKKFLNVIMEIQHSIVVGLESGHEQVVVELEKIAHEHPDFAMVWRELGDAYRIVGDFDKASEAFQTCIKLHPDSQHSRVRLAEIALGQGDLATARDYLEEAMNIGVGFLRFIPKLAEIYVRLEAPDKAARILIDGFEQYPADPNICESMVDVLTQYERTAECAQLLETALAAHPRLIVVRNSLARVLTIQKEYKAAVELLRDGLKMYPDSPEMISNLGLVLATGKDNPDVFYPAEATILLESVCQKTNYTDPRYVHALSLAYGSLNRFDEALVMAERAKKVADDLGEVRYAAFISQTVERMKEAKALNVSPMIRPKSSYVSDENDPEE